LNKALVALQDCARHKYIWGVNDECSEFLLKVLEFRKVIASMRHALSIVCYVQFLVENSEFLNMVYTYKKDQFKKFRLVYTVIQRGKWLQ